MDVLLPPFDDVISVMCIFCPQEGPDVVDEEIEGHFAVYFFLKVYILLSLTIVKCDSDVGNTSSLFS